MEPLAVFLVLIFSHRQLVDAALLAVHEVGRGGALRRLGLSLLVDARPLFWLGVLLLLKYVG